MIALHTSTFENSPEGSQIQFNRLKTGVHTKPDINFSLTGIFSSLRMMLTLPDESLMTHPAIVFLKRA